ncbi:MAG: hypothetical protein GY696_16430 [Gammaproteobacteria bacterium]|nr:hypothetical protein [Gammaproteobacteria bacterium]
MSSEVMSDHVVKAYQPDVYQSLCDCDTPDESKEKRLGKAVDRTLKFMDYALENLEPVRVGKVPKSHYFNAFKFCVRDGSKITPTLFGLSRPPPPPGSYSGTPRF